MTSKGLRDAYEIVEDVSNAALKTVSVASFQDEFRQTAARMSPFSQGSEARAAAAATQPVGPNSVEALTAEVVARLSGTKAQRQAATQNRHEAIRAEMRQAARRSGFGEGAREQAARAIKVREEERSGLRPPNRGI